MRQKHLVLSVLKLMKPDFHKALTAKSDSWLEQKPFVGLAAHKNMSPSRNKMEVLLFRIDWVVNDCISYHIQCSLIIVTGLCEVIIDSLVSTSRVFGQKMVIGYNNLSLDIATHSGRYLLNWGQNLRLLQKRLLFSQWRRSFTGVEVAVGQRGRYIQGCCIQWALYWFKICF